LQTIVKEVGKQKRIVIIFMTDGCDTCNRPNVLIDAQTKLRMFLKNYGSNCVVHVIGYSTGHDLNMMNTLKSLGTTEGIYRYAEGSTGLDEKFRELFEFADSTVELTVQLPNIKEPIRVTGELADSDYVEAECWLSLTDSMQQQPLIVKVGSQEHQIVPTVAQPDTIFLLKALSKRTNDISTQQELDQIQSELQNIKMFGKHIGGNQNERRIAMELRAELQTRLDALHAIMGDIARGTLDGVGALAKMNDLRYADKYVDCKCSISFLSIY